MSKRVRVGHPDFGQAFPCHCQHEKDPDQRIESLRRYSNLGPLSHVNFANTRAEGPLADTVSRHMFRQAFEATARFSEDPNGWLVLCGPSGSGKTHLAVAAANRCVERGQTTFFIVVADLMDHLRATFSPESDVSYDDLFEQVRNVPVLVLDDLGNQPSTPWAQEKLFQVINHRFSRALPTVITVRGPLQRLDEVLRTRIESEQGISTIYHLGQYNTRLARGIGDLPTDMLQRMTFESFSPQGGGNATAQDRITLSHAREMAEKYADHPEGWLLFNGPHGCGKTHLAVAVAGESLRRQRPVFYAFVPSLLDHLRATFSPDSPVAYDELFEQIKTVPLLVLDDLGAETSTPWAEEKLYQIVVFRHESRLPTVITTSFGIDQLEGTKPRIASRLIDNIVNWVPILAPNYRDQGRGSGPSQPSQPRPARGRPPGRRGDPPRNG